MITGLTWVSAVRTVSPARSVRACARVAPGPIVIVERQVA